MDGFCLLDELDGFAVGLEKFLVFGVDCECCVGLDGVEGVDEVLFVHVA